MLCTTCEDLDFDAAVSAAGALHHRSYTDLVESAVGGCDLCTEIKNQRDEERSWHNDPDDNGCRLPIRCFFNDVGQSLDWRVNVDDDPIACMYVHTTNGTHTPTEPVFDLIKLRIRV